MEAQRSRKPFTPGWSQTLTTVEGLPIKSGNKVIPMLRTKRVRENADAEETERIVDIDDINAEENQKSVVSTKSKTPKVDEDGNALPKKKKPSKELVHVSRSHRDLLQLQQHIGDLCLHITSNPERCVLKKKDANAQNNSNNNNGKKTNKKQPKHKKKKGQDSDSEEDDEDEQEDESSSHHIQDLIALLESNDVAELELALPSATLVFRDICPGYRIRLQDDASDKDGKAQSLKKETKRLVDFERLLLKYYQRFLAILNERVALGFGAISNPLTQKWESKEEIAFIALKCQCELLKSLHYFNFRNVLMEAVVARAGAQHPEVMQACCDTLQSVLQNDVLGDISLEFVSTLNKLLKVAKFQIQEPVVKLLKLIKVSISAEEGKKYQILAKKQKKNRKQVRDEVELGMLEADAGNDEVMRKKYQVNALQEISLIYFRIIKQKMGFALFPVALDGLSSITHLLDIDTVADLMALLKSLLELQSPTPPIHVKVMAVFCAMKTLSGPGSELKIDDEPYLLHFKQTLRELPLHLTVSHNPWPAILECVDLIFLKRREERSHIIVSIVRILLFQSMYHLQDSVGSVILALVHAVLLRYPRVRQETAAMKSAIDHALQQGGSQVAKTLAKQLSAMEEEEKVEDLAMQALKEGESMKNASLAADDEESKIGDGTWLIALLRHNIDKNRYRKVVDAMSSREMLPLPLKLSDADKLSRDVLMERVKASIQSCPSTLKKNMTVSHPSTATKFNGQTQSNRPNQQNNSRQNKSTTNPHKKNKFNGSKNKK